MEISAVAWQDDGDISQSALKMKVAELSAFIVSAYQFWARRQERKIAVTSSCQRTAHLAPGGTGTEHLFYRPLVAPAFLLIDMLTIREAQMQQMASATPGQPEIGRASCRERV